MLHQKTLAAVIQVFVYLLPFHGYGQPVFEPKQDVPVVVDESNLKIPWNGGLNSAQYSRADLDGDTSEELIIYHRSANIYQVYKMDNGEFVPAQKLCSLLPDIEPGWVLFVDFNGDGKKDIFSNGSRGVVVYRNVSKAGMLAQWEIEADPLLTTGFSGKINLIANAADVPAITDIDADGDIDILVYNFAIGGYIRYNKNLSREMYGHADSLEFEIATRRWGEFEECDCNLFAFNGETCEDLGNGRVTHAGGKALLAFDHDGDGDKDLLVGHEQCIELYFYENMGDLDSAYMVDYSNSFPEVVNPANFHIFPAGYMEDLDFDGLTDLVVTPSFENNYEYKIDFGNSNWFYKNVGTNDQPDFSYQRSNFLQDMMLDFGENSVPEFADIDADGKIDMLVAANGFSNGNEYSGYLVQLRNMGNAESPSFEIVNDNYLDFASLELVNPMICMVDVNDDGARDLIYTGTRIPNKLESWLLINEAPAGAPFSFDIAAREAITLPETATISDHPEFFDVDADGHVDLLLGKGNGALEYHVNNGSNVFMLADDTFLGIDRDFSLERRNLVATIADLDRDKVADLIVSESRGQGRVYYDFQEQGGGTYFSVDLVFKNDVSGAEEPIKLDQKSWLAASDLFGRGSESIVAGGVRGGLQLFENKSIGGGGDGESKLVVDIYPNPLNSPAGLTIKTNQNAMMQVVSLLGQSIIKPFEVIKYANSVLDLGHLSNGTYILMSESDDGITSSQLFVILR